MSHANRDKQISTKSQFHSDKHQSHLVDQYIARTIHSESKLQRSFKNKTKQKEQVNSTVSVYHVVNLMFQANHDQLRVETHMNFIFQATTITIDCWNLIYQTQMGQSTH